MTIPALFCDPITQEALRAGGDTLVSSRGVVARRVGGLWRFVDPEKHYARSFGLQWKHWKDTLSDSRRMGNVKFEEVMSRTRFDRYDLSGRRLLECGMGGGDDTEALLRLPLSEIYSFDLSTSIERAAQYLTDPRLTIFQASILEPPVLDRAFDIVFCHRVLQHTPDPLASLRAIMRKVKPGGILFAHAYQRSPERMRSYKYKYRRLTTRIRPEWVLAAVEASAPSLRRMSRMLDRLGSRARAFRTRWIPYEYYKEYGNMTDAELEEFCMLNTFDALTPTYDNPLTQAELYGEIEAAGFRIENRQENTSGPLWCTAVLPS